MTTRRRYLVLFFVSVVLSLSAMLVVTTSLWNSSRALASAADALSQDAAPSILFLDAADSDLRRLQVLLKDLIHVQGSSTTLRLEEIGRLRATLRQKLEAYFTLPAAPGEPALWPDIRLKLEEFE